MAPDGFPAAPASPSVEGVPGSVDPEGGTMGRAKPLLAAAVLAAVLAAGLAAWAASAEEAGLPSGDFAVTGATLETATAKGRIEDGVLVVRGGKIAAVGPKGEVAVPE